MLEHAKKYESRVNELYSDIAYDDFYMYEQLQENTYERRDFVSTYNGEIIGAIGYQLRRVENAVDGLYIVHFGGPEAPNRYIFGKDVMTVIKDIFEKYHFNKINFTVVKGNPMEKTYDKLVKQYGGRIVGFRTQDVKLIDGQMYDLKEYEIMAKHYFNKDDCSKYLMKEPGNDS
jgi:hypothetical protein